MNGIIYKITNKINNKAYIGKTIYTLYERWRGHLIDLQRDENRPLYKAMKKYGIQNFTIEEIEEVDTKDLSNREIYWINYFHTYSDGYNATLGGDGRIQYDYDTITQLIKDGKTTKEITQQIGCGVDLVRLVAKKNNLKINRPNLFIEKSKKVEQYNKKGELINQFNSYREAAHWLEDNNYVNGNLGGVASHIGEVCRNIRKSAYGFIWKNY